MFKIPYVSAVHSLRGSTRAESQERTPGGRVPAAPSQEEQLKKLRVFVQPWSCLQIFGRGIRQFSVTTREKEEQQKQQTNKQTGTLRWMGGLSGKQALAG